MPVIRINRTAFCRTIKHAGLRHNELARLIDVDHGNLTRILRGETPPGNKFIAGVWSLFGFKSLSELFVLEDEENDTNV